MNERAKPGCRRGEAAELGKQTFEKALANMRELAEIATKSQSEAWEVVAGDFTRTWKSSSS